MLEAHKHFNMEGYPKPKYHMRGGGSILVTSAVQEKALGPEWLDNKPARAVVQGEVPALEKEIVVNAPQNKRKVSKAETLSKPST